MEKPFESSDLKNPILYPVTRVTSNKSWYLKKYQLYRKYFCIRPCIHSPSTRMGGKSKLRKASLPLVMHLKLDFSSTVTRVTLEWLCGKTPHSAQRLWTHLYCVCFFMCGWQKPKRPQFEPHGWRRHYMVQYYIGSLGSPVYIYGCNLGAVSSSSGVNTDIKLTTIYQVGQCVVHWNNIAGLWITKLWVWALLWPMCSVPCARHLVLISSLTYVVYMGRW